MDTEQTFANNIVAEAFDRGINYFDVAPQYGNAQQIAGTGAGALSKALIPRLQDAHAR